MLGAAEKTDGKADPGLSNIDRLKLSSRGVRISATENEVVCLGLYDISWRKINQASTALEEA